MWVALRLGDSPTLEDPLDLRSLKVVASSPAATMPAEVGHMDGSGHAQISIAWLRAQGPDLDAWQADFDAMLAYAEKKGWLDAAQGTVRAHVEYS